VESGAPPPPVRIPTTRPAPSTTTDPESPLAEKASDDRIVKSLETAVSLSEKYLRVYVANVVARPTVRPVVLPRFKNHDASVAVLVVHLRFSHFVLLDGTPKLQEAVAGKVEVVRVLHVRMHHAGEHVG